jgi:twitching motility protein PilT
MASPPKPPAGPPRPAPKPAAAPLTTAVEGEATGAPFDFKAVLQQMTNEGGSDLHLKVGRPPTMRLNGDLTPMPYASLKPEDLKGLAEQLMNPKQVKQFTDDKECDFAIGVPGIGRFRVNLYQQRGSLCYAMRAIPYLARSLQELEMPKVLEDIALKPRGLVLVTGVTGSGKSTTLAAMVQHINQNHKANVITLEDPIEFLHRDINCHINQREIGTDTQSFAQGLRRVLRQDPDVILVGEIRDLETLDAALKAADTGHLVFSTLHTTDATQTIQRVLSFYPPHQQAEVRFSLASALQAVVSQRLVPRSDKPGRVAAVEVLINTATVRDQIRDMNAMLNIPDLIKDGTVQYGMQSFDQSIMQWYKKGTISYESALFYASSPAEFALRVQGVAGTSDNSWSSFEKK